MCHSLDETRFFYVYYEYMDVEQIHTGLKDEVYN